MGDKAHQIPTGLASNPIGRTLLPGSNSVWPGAAAAPVRQALAYDGAETARRMEQ